MHRKDFLRSTSIIIGSTLLGNHFSFANCSHSFHPFKKGISYFMIKEDLSLIDKFKLVKDVGFDGVEFNSPLQLDINEVLEAADKTGIEIPSTVNKDHWNMPLSSSNPEVRKQIIESVNKTIQQSHSLGADTVLIVPGVVQENMPYELAYKNSLSSIRKLIPTVEKYNMKIGLENVWNNFLISPVEVKNFLDEINHPLVGWYLDVGNVLRYGWPEHWIQTLNTKIFKVHAKGFSRTKMEQEGLRKGFNVELLESDVNWKAVITALKENNYKGQWITLEVSGGDRNYLRKLSNELNTIIGF